MLLQPHHDELHIISRSIPEIGQHVAKPDFIMDADAQQRRHPVMLAQRAAPLFFVGLGIKISFGFRHQVKGERQTDAWDVIQSGQEIDSFDGAVLGMIPMPANQFILISRGFFANAVINNNDPRGTLDRPHQWFDLLPEVDGAFRFTRQHAGHLIVTNRAVHEPRQIRGRGLAKGTKQEIGVEVEECFVQLSSLS